MEVVISNKFRPTKFEYIGVHLASHKICAKFGCPADCIRERGHTAAFYKITILQYLQPNESKNAIQMRPHRLGPRRLVCVTIRFRCKPD